MQAPQRLIKACFFLGLIAVLAGCGGGSSKSPSPPSTNPPDTTPSDTTPNAFSFTAEEGAEPGAVIISNEISISDINAAAPISITNGEYAIGNGAFTSAAGSVSDGDIVRVRLTAADTSNTPAEAILDVGGVSGTFTVTTLLSTTPASFSFAPATDVEPSNVQTSDTATITGIDVAVPISITGGEYAIGEGEFTSADGTIKAGQSVKVRTTASADYNTLVEVVLTIGGVSGTFTATTLKDLIPATASYDIDLGIREDVVITFDEAVNPATLKLEGLLVDLAGNPSWNSQHTELRLSPIEGAWESGLQRLTGSLEDMAGNSTALDFGFEIRLVFESFQAASVVIGQPDFSSGEKNKGGAADADTLAASLGSPTFTNGRLWLPDRANNRILGFDGIPDASNASATWVVGQPDFTSTTSGSGDSKFYFPLMALEHRDRFYAVDEGNSRIAVFDHVPLSPPAAASNVIGQSDFSSTSPRCTAEGLWSPEAMEIVNDTLIVADTNNSRVLIWNSVPTSANAMPADLVLGQGSMTNCTANDDDQDGWDGSASARTLSEPTAVWSDGERLVVADADNHRILIWNTFPAEDFQPAEIVLGQSDFSSTTANDDDQDGAQDRPSARTLSFPYHGVWSNGLQLFVSDSGNQRVLIWNHFPTDNFQAADVVLGQSDFANNVINDDDQDGSEDPVPSARTLRWPVGGFLYRDKTVVLDGNYRALVFNAQ